ncbi:MAG: coniferyl aldehyde dehydrogenase [Saccharospirillum sp.]
MNTRPTSAAVDALSQQFDAQRRAFQSHPFPSVRERRYRLTQLKQLILDHQQAIAEALNQDFGGRAPAETRNAEVLPSIQGLNYALKHLKGWMKPTHRLVPVMFQPASARIQAQPLGVVGIVVPWNYALYLAVGPMTAALAAGNHCMVKLSEYTPAFGALFAELVASVFDRDVISVVNGDVDVARAFSDLPFDHLFFTGSTEVGRQVMMAAARNLTPVTLELGGKSPAYIDRSIPVQEAARRLVFGKCINAGQTCVAPDYVLCPPERIEAFVQAWLAEVRQQYPRPASNPDYASIINPRQYERLLGYLKAAEREGATLHWSEPWDEAQAQRRIPPVIVTGLDDTSALLQDEIFGPVLPVIPCEQPLDAVDYINRRPRPLALYVFGYDKALRPIFTERTHSGGLVFNDALFHVAVDNLPFGGVGASGMGHYHGPEGFATFSKLKPVVAKQRLNSLTMAYPPYNRWIHRALGKLFIR